jgi:hypothetical protein
MPLITGAWLIEHVVSKFFYKDTTPEDEYLQRQDEGSGGPDRSGEAPGTPGDSSTSSASSDREYESGFSTGRSVDIVNDVLLRLEFISQSELKVRAAHTHLSERNMVSNLGDTQARIFIGRQSSPFSML